MEFLIWLQQLRNPVTDAIFSLITHLGEETFFIVFALAFFWCVDKYRGYYLLFTGFAGTISIQILKMTFRIPRPWVLEPDFPIVESARAEATGYSFPSGHTQCATNLYGGIARLSKQLWLRILCIVGILLIAFSRMYLGVHTPKDVLVSLAIGVVLVLVLYPIVEKGRHNPKYMWGLIGVCFLLALGNLLFMMLTSFPADVDAANLLSGKTNAWKMFGAVCGVCLLYPADHYWIRFETKAIWWAQLLKLVGGFSLVLAVRYLLKAPLNALCGELVGGGVRYFLMVAVAGVLWPMTFRFFAKLGKKKEEA